MTRKSWTPGENLPDRGSRPAAAATGRGRVPAWAQVALLAVLLAGLPVGLPISSGLFSPPARAASVVYIITRDTIGDFVASHQLYDIPQPRLVQVRYCGRAYYVYPETVKWTEDAAQHGYRLALERPDGAAWRPICLNPQLQVRSADLPATPPQRRHVASFGRAQVGDWVYKIMRNRGRNPYGE